MKKDLFIIKAIISHMSNDIFQFDNSIFLKDVPYITCGAPSLIFNFNNNNLIIKNND